MFNLIYDGDDERHHDDQKEDCKYFHILGGLMGS